MSSSFRTTYIYFGRKFALVWQQRSFHPVKYNQTKPKKTNVMSIHTNVCVYKLTGKSTIRDNSDLRSCELRIE